MNKKYLFSGLVIVAIIIVAGLIVSQNNSNEQVNNSTETTSDKMETDKNMMQDKMDGEEKMQVDDKMVKAGTYKTYSLETINTEQAAGNKVVLFFYAPWCPYCRAADKAFNENLDKIPAGITLLKIDYDSNTELRKKYGVTYQHTFVQLDNNLDKVTSWVSGDIDLLIKNVK